MRTAFDGSAIAAAYALAAPRDAGAGVGFGCYARGRAADHLGFTGSCAR